MNDLALLIAKIEAAPEGSAEINLAIATFLGWQILPGRGSFPGHLIDPDGMIRQALPDWSRSLDAKLPGEEIVSVHLDWIGKGWRATARVTHPGRADFLLFSAAAATEPLARRAAALRAIQHEREGA